MRPAAWTLRHWTQRRRTGPRLGTAIATMALLGSTGCRNPCQSLCDEMADFAKDCGYTVERASLQGCYDEQARAETTKTERQACREYDNDVENWWDCEDIGAYFGAVDTAE